MRKIETTGILAKTTKSKKTGLITLYIKTESIPELTYDTIKKNLWKNQVNLKILILDNHQRLLGKYHNAH